MSNNEDLDKKLAVWEAKAKIAIKYIAVDASGNVWGYDKKPKLCKEIGAWLANGAEAIYLGETNNKDLYKNWDKTLRKVNYE